MSWDYWQEPIEGTFRIREPVGDANRRIIGHVLTEDDARLIAAAPDMLALLRRIRDSFPGYIPDFIEAVNAVIAKTAKGASPKE